MEKEEEQIKQIIQMVETLQLEIKNEYQKLFDFVDEFNRKYLDEKKRLPYYINVIDELHINENGHSRILMRLLNFQNSKGKYEILESLLQYIKDKTHDSKFSNIVINSPKITQEEARIDLWVRDKGYAIIFENKVYNASDREAQLSRYINKTIEQKYDENNIFVVYLSQLGKEPDAQSWGNYKEKFKSRYVNLSFRNDILPWLKENILPNIRKNDSLLQSAVLQYIDYLEGLFYLRIIQNQMIMNLDNFIKNYLELNKKKDDKERISVLREKISDFNIVKQKMESLMESYRQNIFKEWKEKTKSLFSELYPNEDGGVYTDVSLIIERKPVFIHISENSSGLYCQVEFRNKEFDITGTCLESSLNDILTKKNKECIWEYLQHDDYDTAYQLFVDVVNRCIELSKQC